MLASPGNNRETQGVKQVKRLGLIATLAMMIVGVSASSAFAQTVGPFTPTGVTQTGGLHFVGQPTVTATKTSQSAFLTCAGEVAGAGTSATAVCSANVVVTRGCVNKGGNEPRGLQQSFETTTGSQTFETRSGRGSFLVTTTAVTAAPFTCPSANMTPVLVSVLFTDITLTVTSQTGTTVATFADIDP